MERSRSAFPDWAHLPPLVLHWISDRVKSITDYVRFRAVCSPWRSASLPKPRHLPPQLPWLMFPWDSQDEEDDGIRLFYDHWESKTHKIHLPDTIGMMCRGSYRGWLFLDSQQEGAEVFLLNPLTRARIQLPSFTAADNESDEADIDIIKVTFSTELSDPDCLIIAFPLVRSSTFCCRVGDPCWTKVLFYAIPDVFPDGTYYNERFYVLCLGVMHVVDTNKPGDMIVYDFRREIRCANVFLQGEKSGVYVVAFFGQKEQDEATAQKDEDDQAAHDNKGTTETTPKLKIELYQFIEQPLELKKITNTSDTALFFTDYYYCLAVCSDDWDSLDGGSVYIQSKHVPSTDTDGDITCYNIFSGKLNDFKYERVASEVTKKPSFGPRPPAMWFQPSFV
ncbi:F-box protein skip23 [Rhynchospora pubera]|uniref:F-box protein skip23 n=1 Tax=Rhynchospora pubera TaxID=906938 RepID=A0AAV8GQH5_9POAL|nr:F-box protein skip23 [Rhynchospora pubera]